MNVASLHRFPSEHGVFPIGALVMFVAGMLVCYSLSGGEANREASAEGVFVNVPEPVTEADFTALKKSSPFLRPLDPSQSLVLIGIARINGDLFATVLDRETKVTHIVSRSVNPDGWQLAGVEGDEANLETVSAKISMAGGEVFSIRFDESQLNPASTGPRIPPELEKRITAEARNYRRGISSDGFPGRPPPEIVAKLSKMSEEQRKRLIYEMSLMRKRGAGSEERRKVFVRKVDRALQERR